MIRARIAKLAGASIVTAPLIFLGMISAMWSQIPPSLAHGAQVCASTTQCKIGDVGCAAAVTAAVAACETKIAAYNIYMDQMGAGVTKHQLPAVYRDILRGRYTQTNFDTFRFGFSDRQPPNNATTDCNTTYFNSADYVDRLRNASANPNWFWLLHEVAHPEQCTTAGGREAYAKRWWDEMDAALARQGTKVNVLQTPEALAQQIGSLFAQVHDMMPMEQQATAKANAVLNALPGCCISQQGAPIRPLAISTIQERSDAGGIRRILSVQTSNGDAPFTTRWWVKSPGDRDFIEQPQNLIRGLEFLWTPNNNQQYARTVNSSIESRRVWDHEIRVRVLQQSSLLEFKDAARTISISERTSITLPKSGPQFDKLPTEISPSKVPDISPSIPDKPSPKPGPLPTKPPFGP